MKTRSKLLALPAVAAAVVATAVAFTGASAAQDPAGTTITFQESDKGARFAIADVAPKSRGKGEPFMSLGDNFTFSNPLLRDGQRAGTVYNHCVVTQPGPISRHGALCEAVLALPDGNLFAQAATTRGGGDRVAAAVTGGTGAYAGARGTSTSESGTTTVTILP